MLFNVWDVLLVLVYFVEGFMVIGIISFGVLFSGGYLDGYCVICGVNIVLVVVLVLL